MSKSLQIPNWLVVIALSTTLYQALVIRSLTKSLITGKRQFNKLHEAADYLLEIINENDIELTEFDVIAMTAIADDINNTRNSATS